MLNTWFQRTSFVVIVFLSLQTFLPFWVLANTSSESNNTNLNNIIIICSGNKLEYFTLSENGHYIKTEEPEKTPNSFQLVHCDTCVFPNFALLQIDKSLNYSTAIDIHERPFLSSKLPLNLHKHRPPLRAPPA